jgi:RNA polymerase sigma-70 factor (ECF subfamily)
MGKKTLLTHEMLDSSDDFTAAYESHSKRIYQFMYWRTRDNVLSEDLTSSVFEKAWRSRTSFKGGSVQAWLYRIARNALTDHWRKKKDIAVDNIESLPGAVMEESESRKLDTQFAAQELNHAVYKLPKQMQTIIELRFMSNLSSKQVAKQLGISENNVRIIQYRALKKLRTYLK